MWERWPADAASCSSAMSSWGGCAGRGGGGGPKAGGKKTPEVLARIETLMQHETAGDPMTGLRWTRKTTEKIACELAALGLTVSARTVAKLLPQMGYSLRVNHKKIAHG